MNKGNGVVAVKIEVGRGNLTAMGGLSTFSHVMKRMSTRNMLLPIYPVASACATHFVPARRLRRVSIIIKPATI